jgi:CheY-like chemotaxis protein
MDERGIPPYRFPTTTVIVDDDASFLHNFALELDEDLAFRLFDSPLTALEHLGRTPAAARDRCLHSHRETIGWPMREHFLRVDLAAVEEEVTNPARFEAVSVLVVDYAMPGMDGLALCERLRDLGLRKILLTGVADEKVAVSAFNRGLIDRFVRKHDRDAARQVNQAIRQLQELYFRDASRVILESVRRDDAPFLTDPAFRDHFTRLCERHGIIEYYYAAEPSGFLLLDRAARRWRLVIMDDDMMTAQREIAEAQGAPDALVGVLERRERIPYFWQTGGYYRRELADWQAYLHTPEVFDGRRRYHMALVEDPSIYHQLGWNIQSYDHFLENPPEARGADARPDSGA